MAERPDERITVTVVRSGGVAGMRRSWTLSADGEAAAGLLALADEAAGAASDARDATPDGIRWTVTLASAGGERVLRMSDGGSDGPARALVDHVREQGRPVPAHEVAP